MRPGLNKGSARFPAGREKPAGSFSSTLLITRPSPTEYARGKAYSNTRYRHFFVNTLYGFLLLLVLLHWRVAPALRNLAEQASPRRLVQLILFAPLMLLIIALLGLPSDIWDQSLDHAFGLSVQPWPAWYRTGSRTRSSC
jgi:CAAX prenyl protease N-terminal, five membrane helices